MTEYRKGFLAGTALTLAILWLAACAGFAKTVSKPEGALICHAADAATTAVAIHNGATELNPLMAGLIDSVGIAGFVAFKLVVGYWVYRSLKDEQKRGKDITFISGLHNMVICGVAVHNMRVISGM